MVEHASVPGSVEWWHARHTATVRRRPRPDGLTLERIMEVALDVLRHEGLDALTMRRIAAALGTSHTSLYRHVASREELLVELVDHILGDVRIDPTVTGWRAQAEANARSLRRTLLAHPALVPLMTASQLLGPNALRSRELGLRILVDAGADPALAVHGYLVVARFVIGSAMLDTGGAARTPGARKAMTRLF